MEAAGISLTGQAVSYSPVSKIIIIQVCCSHRPNRFSKVRFLFARNFILTQPKTISGDITKETKTLVFFRRNFKGHRDRLGVK